MTTMTAPKPASPKQLGFIESLTKSRQLTDDQRSYVKAQLPVLDGDRADKAIKWLLSLPKTKASYSATVAEAGFYLHEDKIYAVVTSKKTNRRSARLLVVTTASDGSRRGRYVYAPSMVYTLTADEKLSKDLAEAKSLALGVCVLCGKQLTDPKSVAQSIGPVCIKKLS